MRNIFIVNATQVVVSENHPEGMYSVIPDYPKKYDTRDYNDSEETALIVAQAEFADRVKQNTLSKNRAMWTVTLENASGRMIQYKTFGAFPVLEPTPEPEPEVEPEENENP